MSSVVLKYGRDRQFESQTWSFNMELHSKVENERKSEKDRFLIGGRGFFDFLDIGVYQITE